MTALWRRVALVIAVLTLAGAPPAGAAILTNPVLAGDHPDPTIVRAGGAFYASATGASWAPIFPVFRSTDLVTWRQVGAVLPTAPRWAAGNFWAPELVRWSGRMLAFYSASRRGGSPCLGVASAARPEGPWHDRGPVLCRPGGTIDVDPFSDADGSRWLLFKRLGAGHGIYAVRFSERRLRAVGHAHELIAPDANWEQGVTEGPTLVRRGGSYLLFYAGGQLLPAALQLRGGRRARIVAARALHQGPGQPAAQQQPGLAMPGPRHDDRPRARRAPPPAPRLSRRRCARPPAIGLARSHRHCGRRVADHRRRPGPRGDRSGAPRRRRYGAFGRLR
jgi:hypothetical protein